MEMQCGRNVAALTFSVQVEDHCKKNEPTERRTKIQNPTISGGADEFSGPRLHAIGRSVTAAPQVTRNAVGDRSRWVRVVERIGDDLERCVGKVGCNIIPPS